MESSPLPLDPSPSRTDMSIELLCNLLKNTIVEFFTDIISLQYINIQQRATLELGLGLVKTVSSQTLMKVLSSELTPVDIDELSNNPKKLFDAIYACLAKRSIQNDYLENNIKIIWTCLSAKDKSTVTEYAKYMKRMCTNYTVLCST